MKKRSDGRYLQTVTIDGVQKYIYGKSRNEVLLKLRKLEEAKQTGKRFTDVAEEWWRRQEPKLSPTSLSGYRRGLRFAEDYFGKMPITEIKPSNVLAYQDFIADKHGMAKNTLNNAMIVLRGILKYAVLNGYAETLPSSAIPLPKNLRKEKRPACSDEDCKRIFDNVGISDFALIPFIALVTGMRKAEILGLTEDSIDWVNRYIRINKSLVIVNNRPMEKSPKTQTGIRDIPIPDVLYDRLPHRKGYLFGRNGNPYTDKQFRADMGAYRTATGVTATMHQIRHAFASRIVLRTDIKSAQQILGHANASTTMDIYAEAINKQNTENAMRNFTL